MLSDLTRYMERSNSMAREKRGLDSTSAEDGQPDRKRPALARSLSLSLCLSLPSKFETIYFILFKFCFMLC